MMIDRRTLLKAAGAASLIGAAPRALWAAGPKPLKRQTTRSASPKGSSSCRRSISSRQPFTMASFRGRFCVSRKESASIIDIYNDTDTPELVHPHGLIIPIDADGAAEEGSPFVPAHGMRRICLCAKAFGLPLLSHACVRLTAI